jgi:hypothetical protein
MTVAESVLPAAYATDLPDFLAEEGFRPKLDEGDVQFKYEGGSYFVIADHRDAVVLPVLEENVTPSVNAYLPDAQSFRVVLLRGIDGLHYLTKVFWAHMRAQMEN